MNRLPACSGARRAAALPSDSWDVAVVGAGPAGSLVARELARLGLTVLLVDKSHFPRSKVCGCCLSPAALDILARAGLGNLPDRLHAIPLERMHLASGQRSVDLDLAGGVSLSRAAFDAALVAEAISAGVTFRDGVTAQLGTSTGTRRTILLRKDAGSLGEVQASVIVDASGIVTGLLGREPDVQKFVTCKSRIGAGAVLQDAPSSFRERILYMAVGDGGYVGLVRLEDNSLDIAAAMDPGYVRSRESVGHAAAEIVASAGLSKLPLEKLAWRGTPRLTQRLDRVAHNRLFAIGDAASYVEPFTGEGIGWALASGWYSAPLIHEAVHGNCDQQELRWTMLHHNLLDGRMRKCGWLASLLRRPMLRSATLKALAVAPGIARPVVQHLHAPMSA